MNLFNPLILLDLIGEYPAYFFFIFLVITAVLLIWVRFRRYDRRKAKPSPQPDHILTPKSETLFFSSRHAIALPRVTRLLVDVNPTGTEWARLMRQFGRHLLQSGVGQVFFIHGTFVGSDPINLIDGFSGILPQKFESMVEKFRAMTKYSSDSLTRDIGNFPPLYSKIFSAYTEIESETFIWSSANHHFARVVGAHQLLARILDVVQQKNLSQRRLLFWGHSHAGQLFAILSNLAFNQTLREVLHEHYMGLHPRESSQDWRERYRQLEELNLDFVTLGTPVRYSFQLQNTWRLLNIVNDRSNKSGHALDIKGALTTRDGDYIQHWAVAGSDTQPLQARVRQVNRALDLVLDQGISLNMVERVSRPIRQLQPSGINALVDYHDSSRRLPNFVLTNFGHGTYTRYKHMLFNIALVVHLLYQGEHPQEILKND